MSPLNRLCSPTWTMGRVITTNSATLVNKGLELLEAHLLYGVDLDRIDVVVHPQSIVHSMVQFIDGSTLAQCSPPDMKLPIALVSAGLIGCPGVARPCDWSTASSWTFEPLTTWPSPRSSWPARRGGWGNGTGGLQRGQRGMRGRLPRWPARLRSASSTSSPWYWTHVEAPPISSSHDVGSMLAATRSLTLEVVLAADAWARSRAAELVSSDREHAR